MCLYRMGGGLFQFARLQRVTMLLPAQFRFKKPAPVLISFGSMLLVCHGTFCLIPDSSQFSLSLFHFGGALRLALKERDTATAKNHDTRSDGVHEPLSLPCLCAAALSNQWHSSFVFHSHSDGPWETKSTLFGPACLKWHGITPDLIHERTAGQQRVVHDRQTTENLQSF
jgi:hypothetical protein